MVRWNSHESKVIPVCVKSLHGRFIFIFQIRILTSGIIVPVVFIIYKYNINCFPGAGLNDSACAAVHGRKYPGWSLYFPALYKGLVIPFRS